MRKGKSGIKLNRLNKMNSKISKTLSCGALAKENVKNSHSIYESNYQLLKDLL